MKLINDTVYFTVTEVADYFQRSVPWVHYGEKQGYWVYEDNTPMEFLRLGGNKARMFTAQNVTDMAQALGRLELMDSEQIEELTKEMKRFL